MALKVGGTEVVDNNRQLKNIASIDSGTVTAFNSALNTDPTKGTLTKTFAENETADITLSPSVTVGPVVSATKEVPQTGISTKGNWDVNSTASNYDFHNTAANVTLTPTTTTDFASTSNAANAFTQSSSVYSSTVGGSYPQGFSWAGNGMYYYIARDKIIYRFELTTAYDLTTAANSGVSFSTVSTWNLDIADLYVTNDGTQLFTVHANQDKYVARYTMSTAHDLANASYSNNVNLHSYSGATLANPNSITFKPDGTVMYITDLNSAIFSYSINSSYPFNVGYVTAQTGAEGFGSEIPNSSGVRGSAFTSDGTKMYILDDSASENIVEYSLSTAWDITTKSYTNNSFHYKPLLSNNLDNVPSLTLINDNAFVFLDNNSARVRKVAMGTSSSLVLGSGSFSASDVGKRIVGNGGDVILTSTGGAFDTTGGSAFTDNSTIAAGSWSMFGLKSAGDADGITIPGKASSGNYTLLDTTDGHTHKVTLADTHASGEQGFTIDPNGLYLFATDTTNDRVKRYDFGTAWDLSTLNTSHTSGQVVNTSGYDGAMVDVAFNPSGTKMYVAGQDSDYVYQWNLTTAWDLSTAGYSGSLNVQASNRVAGGFNGIYVTPDGTKLYTICRNTDNVVRWNFDNTQNVANCSFSALASVNSVNQYPFDIAFNPDGTVMYLSGNNSGFYKFNLTTAFDISSGFSHDTSFSVTVNSNAVEGFFIKPDETKIYTMYNNQVSQWDIGSFTQPTAQYHVGVTNSGGQIDSSSFVDINSMTAAQSAGTGTVHYAVSTDGRTTWSVAKGTSGIRPIVRNNSGTWQYNSESSTTTTGYNLSSLSYDNKSFGTGRSLNDLAVKPDGTKIYYIGNNANIHERTLSTANDITTAGTEVTFNQASQDNDPRDITFKPDGTKMYLSGDQYNYIFQYSLSTAWDISTASYDNKYYNPSITPYSTQFKSDGTKMYICNNTTIAEFSLSTAWDVSTASSTSNTLTISSQDGTMLGIFLKPDGTQMITVGQDNDKIYVYNFGTAWDLSTLSYSNNSYSVASQAQTPRGIAFNSDGTKAYIADYSSQNIYQYSTGATTTAYVTTPTWADGTTNDELYTLQQALSVEANRMDKTQLDAVADANHFPTGNSLDLMIALRIDTAASTVPTSDGVTLNYDAAALNEGAVLGTDYDFFHPAANKVQIKSLAAQNLKIRVV